MHISVNANEEFHTFDCLIRRYDFFENMKELTCSSSLMAGTQVFGRRSFTWGCVYLLRNNDDESLGNIPVLEKRLKDAIVRDEKALASLETTLKQQNLFETSLSEE